MIELSEKWAKTLRSQPETGMGFQVVSIYLKDGRKFDDVTIVGGTITGIKGEREIPFAESDIAKLVVTHGG